MEILKKIKMNLIIDTILSALIGIVLVWNPFAVSNGVAWVLGAIILAAGVIDIIKYVVDKEYSYFTNNTLFSAVLKCIFGVFILTHTDLVFSLFSYIFAVIIIVGSIISFEAALELKRAEIPGSLVHILISFAILSCGIVMLFVPFSASNTVLTICGAALILLAVIQTVTLIRVMGIRKQLEKRARMNVLDQGQIPPEK